MSGFVEVYIASDITFAYLVKPQLEDAGIPVQIANETLGDASCLDGVVLRPAPHAAETRSIIEEMRSAAPTESNDLDDLEPDEP